jgi:carboxyl-terminal processing protease
LTTARYYTPSNRSIQAKGIDPDIVVEEELPEELKAKAAAEKPRGEASLPGHLKNSDGAKEGDKKEESGSSAYVPKEPEKDTQLQYALSMLRGTLPPKVGAEIAKPAEPSSAAGSEADKKPVPH